MRNKKAKGLRKVAKLMFQVNPEKGSVKEHYKRLKNIYKKTKNQL